MSHEKERAEFEAWYTSAIWGNEDYKQSLFRAWREGREDLIAKLATVSVEPDLIKTDEVDRYGDSLYVEAYSAEALAAARMQALEEAAKRIDHLGQASLSVLASLA